ncbi:hypothetical protein LR48_Vigan09g086400 [Vigna angularis]|uniref:Putative plant transposon protein domain-containing protein n=1 Tax=Phaseolus angularis TaxID=3914 RepID=A0A0L9VAW2_PHAAN|nr:hypothetical protein LR48_Vigan09g086400 [Vigna angularis]
MSVYTDYGGIANYDKIERILCVPGARFQRNKNESPIHIRRSYLTPLAKYWMAFTHANIQPCSHVSDITISRAILLYCVLRGLNVNIGQVRANEIRSCASAVNTKAPLGHPSLITHLYMIIGLYDTPPRRRWMMEEFNTCVRWPEDQSQPSGVGAVDASTMEEEDDDDEEEEEDSDDSQG